MVFSLTIMESNKKFKKGKKKSSKHLKTKYHIKKIHEPNKSQEKF